MSNKLLMLCEYPKYIGYNHYVPCRQCDACRLAKQKEWASRIELEQLAHSESVFATLTYDENHIPPNNSLVKKDALDWMMRLRITYKRDYPFLDPSKLSLRYFMVGEYGDITSRPHIHAALFGYPLCHNGQSHFNQRTGSCCEHCDRIARTWGKGLIDSKPLQGHETYIAGYVTKKMTRKDDKRLDGKEPEFARMSLRPGIGAPAAEAIANTLSNPLIRGQLQDVPAYLEMKGERRRLKLGRYIQRRTRTFVFGSPDTPPAILEEYAAHQQAIIDLAVAQEKRPQDLIVEQAATPLHRVRARMRRAKKTKI